MARLPGLLRPVKVEREPLCALSSRCILRLLNNVRTDRLSLPEPLSSLFFRSLDVDQAVHRSDADLEIVPSYVRLSLSLSTCLIGQGLFFFLFSRSYFGQTLNRRLIFGEFPVLFSF